MAEYEIEGIEIVDDQAEVVVRITMPLDDLHESIFSKLQRDIYNGAPLKEKRSQPGPKSVPKLISTLTPIPMEVCATPTCPRQFEKLPGGRRKFCINCRPPTKPQKKKPKKWKEQKPSKPAGEIIDFDEEMSNMKADVLD